MFNAIIVRPVVDSDMSACARIPISFQVTSIFEVQEAASGGPSANGDSKSRGLRTMTAWHGAYPPMPDEVQLIWAKVLR
jgi:hypothetical protein